MDPEGRPAGGRPSTVPPPVRPSVVRPRAVLLRHGETTWSATGRHTGLTDVALTAHGEQQARDLRARVAGQGFSHVWCSPLARALRTAELAGLAGIEVVSDLLEWDYGDMEGRTTDEIRQEFPGWTIWRGPWPGGETIDDVAARADRVVARVRAIMGMGPPGVGAPDGAGSPGGGASGVGTWASGVGVSGGEASGAGAPGAGAPGGGALGGEASAARGSGGGVSGAGVSGGGTGASADGASGDSPVVALIAHGHILRVVAARWLGAAPEAGRWLALETGTLSVLGWEHETAVIQRWNT